MLNFLLFDSVIYNLLSAENQFFIENIDFSTHFVDRLPLPVYAVQQLAETLRWEGAGSITEGITGIFRRINPSGRTMFLGSTQPLTRNISWRGGG